MSGRYPSVGHLPGGTGTTDLPPEEAWRRAWAWRRHAESVDGAERAHAERTAAYWFEQHRAAEQRRRPAPEQRIAGPHPLAAAHAPPGRVPPPRRRSRPGAVVALVLVVAVAVVVAVVGVGTVSAALRGASERLGEGVEALGSWDSELGGPIEPPQEWEPLADGEGGVGEGYADPGADVDAEPAPSGLAGTEERWRAGEYAQTLPDPVPGEAPGTGFLPAYPDPTDWVVALDPANEGLRVVVTDDPGLNCGMTWVEWNDARDGAAGCFDPSYPRTIFLWWSDAADPATKEFVAAHELSHLIQWWHQFDVMQSATDAGLGADERWTTAVETDATCRVLSWGGYSQEAADRSSSPCTADDWSPSWLAEQADALGVTVVDY